SGLEYVMNRGAESDLPRTAARSATAGHVSHYQPDRHSAPHPSDTGLRVGRSRLGGAQPGKASRPTLRPAPVVLDDGERSDTVLLDRQFRHTARNVVLRSSQIEILESADG